jgi:predicted methyltransferase
MKIGDYISIKTVQELTCEQYQKFREYLRSYGYSIKEEFGAYVEKSSMYLWHKFVRLNRFGDLVWSSDTWTDSGREITLNKILKVIMDIKPAVETYDFRSMVINGLDASIAYHQATIEDLLRQRNEMKRRQTGRSLGIALTSIGAALSNPNTNITVIDHDNKPQTNSLLVEYIETLIEKLGLKNIHVNKTKRVIRYVLSK